MPLLLTTDAVTSIAQKHSATPAQVLLAWGVQRGTVVIPKSEDEGRMRANLEVRPFLLCPVVPDVLCIEKSVDISLHIAR